MRHPNEDDRDAHIRLRLLRDVAPGDPAGQEDEDERGDDQPRARQRGVDEPGHPAAPAPAPASGSGTACTASPSLTNSWPTVMRRTRSGSPATHSVPGSAFPSTATGRKRTTPASSTA